MKPLRSMSAILFEVVLTLVALVLWLGIWLIALFWPKLRRRLVAEERNWEYHHF